MTVERGQQAVPADPLASERLALLGRTAAAQLDLERVIASLQASAMPIPTELLAQQGELATLIREVATAGTAELPALQRAIATAVAATSSAVQQAGQSASSNVATLDLAERVKAARQTIESVGRDLFDKKVLDPYLQFSSPEDEAAYRKRERENAAAIEREKTKGTIEGDRNAAALLERQLLDAGEHGATASPDYDRMLTDIRAASNTLEAQSPTKTATSKDTQGTEKLPEGKSDSLDDVLATLKSAGVTTLTEPKESIVHGLNADARSADIKTAPLRS